MRRTIQAERAVRDRDLRIAQASVAELQAPVASYAAQIAALEARIAAPDREIRWWRHWYTGLRWWDQAWGWTRMSAEIAWRGTEIVSLRATIGTLQASKRTAEGPCGPPTRRCRPCARRTRRSPSTRTRGCSP